ncbi:MAG TPA: cation diffusion facilitator family transporter [Solirubrobacterales bacterium]|nr:cation diffusion facilitator family transporter [Solirubrobacterales bacterium]HMW44604.1 cation diffusion facilitator family transporter [Solirubrobacterales bacterium]HMX70675.1 cation diffusion facilitator family transporter [Solirubrobacterales bacterium]HMY25548.1 cation diffusion facilitator family transporter [Solirubrobacterales bacterium]HNA23538.1 cation diffusion facilitator family transporter [Solirubrobacterales bacterium]
MSEASAAGGTDSGGEARRKRLIRVISVSITVAVLTIGMKLAAWLLTGSVGLLSDAAESVVNLVAAGVALIVILWSTRPADEDHTYGHEKADYLSAGLEGALILLAAVTIAYAAIERLIHPVELNSVGIGLAISAAASVLNLLAARLLIRTGEEETSLVLVADGRHLMADVITSAGVIVGVALVWLTGLERLDPVIALVVAANIIRTGTGLVSDSMSGLMDKALPEDELQKVSQVLDGFESDDIRFHALRTRRAGRRTFISIHVLVPGNWSVKQGHDLLERVEEDLRACFEQTTVFTHLEPIEDPVSFADTGLDRTSNPHTGG